METSMKNTIVGFIAGVVVSGIIGWNVMPGMMIKEVKSPYSVKETVEKIHKKAKATGWKVPRVWDLYKSVNKGLGEDKLGPVVLIDLCSAEHAYNVLKHDENKVVSVFMPCTISIYEKTDKSVWVGYVNAPLLGGMFGGSVAETMEVVGPEQRALFDFAK